MSTPTSPSTDALAATLKPNEITDLKTEALAIILTRCEETFEVERSNWLAAFGLKIQADGASAATINELEEELRGLGLRLVSGKSAAEHSQSSVPYGGVPSWELGNPELLYGICAHGEGTSSDRAGGKWTAGCVTPVEADDIGGVARSACSETAVHPLRRPFRWNSRRRKKSIALSDNHKPTSLPK